VFDQPEAVEGFLFPEIYQAQGVLSVRLDISVAEATEAMRACADREGAPLVDIALEVLAGRPSLD
jgi:hypothetical protein